MNNELHAMIEYMERERGIDRESLIVAVELREVVLSRKPAELWAASPAGTVPVLQWFAAERAFTGATHRSA